MTTPYTIKTLLAFAIRALNSDEAALEVQLLLQHVLDVNRAWLIAHESDALQANHHAAFEALLQRRLQGEPMAYILGYREFYGLNLKVTPDTLIPRPDTETLVEAALAKIEAQTVALTPNPSPKGRGELNSLARRRERVGVRASALEKLNILDLGTGSGAIALAIAKNRPHASVTAVDASKAALKVAKKNAESLNISNVAFIQSHWFESLANQKFDIIVSNPPYIEAQDAHLSQGDLRFEPASALASGADGLDDIRQIIDDCLVYLKPQGWLMLEHGYNQAAQVADLMAAIGLSSIATVKDLGGNHRVTLGKNPLIVSTHWD